MIRVYYEKQMGVIYSSREVAHGAVPADGAHERAAELVIDRIPRLEQTQLTIVYGSVVDSDKKATPRSDLDVLVTYSFDSDEYVALNGIKTVLDDIRDKTHVKIEPNIWPSDEHVSSRIERMHDRLFSQYLAEAMVKPDWIVGEIDQKIIDITNMELDSEALQKVVLGYLVYKHSQITRAPREYTESDQNSLTAMQRVLELPKSFTRKANQLTDLGADIDANSGNLFDRADDETIAAIQGLNIIDKDYTQYIIEILSEINSLTPNDIQEYHDWLSDRYTKALSLGATATTGFSRLITEQVADIQDSKQRLMLSKR